MPYRKLAFTIVTAAVLGCASFPSAAGGIASGTIKYLDVRSSDGLIHFELSVPKTGSPSCARAPYWIVKSENSDTGKRQFGMLLAAQATGQQVFVTGTGQCTRWLDGEDVDSLKMLP